MSAWLRKSIAVIERGEEVKEWLILSLKWSRSRNGGEFAAWYRPDSCGYTMNLDEAGRFTEEEARERTSGGEGVTAMVHERVAYSVGIQRTTVDASESNLQYLLTLKP